LQKNEATLGIGDTARLNDYKTGARGKAIKQYQDRIDELQIKIGTKKEEQQKLMTFSPDSVFKDELQKIQEERAKKEADAKSPVKVSSPFGMRKHPITGVQAMHEGADVPMKEGDNVYAAEKGTVKISGSAAGYGNMIEIDHGNGRTTKYAHLKSMQVAVVVFYRWAPWELDY
jgi:murein DD-endopeptidase MepM/ murein hydrolase activator NlpD